MPPPHDLGRLAQIRQARVGAGPDEDAIHWQASKLLSCLQTHIGQRTLDGAALFCGHVGRVGRASIDIDHLRGVRAPCDLRLQAIAIDRDLALEDGVFIAGQGAPMGERAIPHGVLGRPGATMQPVVGLVVGRHEAAPGAHLDGEIAQGQAPLDGERAGHRPRKFDDMAPPAGNADLR